jgi:hypothetical protein
MFCSKFLPISFCLANHLHFTGFADKKQALYFKNVLLLGRENVLFPSVTNGRFFRLLPKFSRMTAGDFCWHCIYLRFFTYKSPHRQIAIFTQNERLFSAWRVT